MGSLCETDIPNVAYQSIRIIAGTDREGSEDLRWLLMQKWMHQWRMHIITYNIIRTYHTELHSINEDIHMPHNNDSTFNYSVLPAAYAHKACRPTSLHYRISSDMGMGRIQKLWCGYRPFPKLCPPVIHWILLRRYWIHWHSPLIVGSMQPQNRLTHTICCATVLIHTLCVYGNPKQ